MGSVDNVGTPGNVFSPVVPLEVRLAGDLEASLDEATKFFHGEGEVHDALRAIVSRLDNLGIPYAVAGGMALNAHGFRRVTEDVDILVSAESIAKIHEAIEGLGYVPIYKGSKNLRDVRHGVRIEFLLAGQFPGDGRAKPVSFPSPELVGEVREGVRYLNLPTLVELKLASGMSNEGRMKDLSDVQQLIVLLSLPKDFSLRLNPYVRPEFEELWRASNAQARFVRIWQRTPETEPALNAMLADGIKVEAAYGVSEASVLLVTSDPTLAAKYQLLDESKL
ncbi:MAG: nucleotidyltransferase family protein [Planctomycetia bacterium]|nr:nucleotidyltransferase family protein [Planctomycetia bacterium]